MRALDGNGFSELTKLGYVIEIADPLQESAALLG